MLIYGGEAAAATILDIPAMMRKNTPAVDDLLKDKADYVQWQNTGVGRAMLGDMVFTDIFAELYGRMEITAKFGGKKIVEKKIRGDYECDREWHLEGGGEKSYLCVKNYNPKRYFFSGRRGRNKNMAIIYFENSVFIDVALEEKYDGSRNLEYIFHITEDHNGVITDYIEDVSFNYGN